MTSTTKFELSKRLQGVSESATLKLNAAVQAMKAQGIDVVNLTAGEPDFNVPDAAKEAVCEAVAKNQSKYTPAAGMPQLRELIAKRTNGQQPSVQPQWKTSDVVVNNGGKQALFNVLMAVINPGDEVLIPSPFWLSYPEMVKIAGGTPKIIRAPFEQGFKMTPAQLKAAITPRTKMLILNSPSNPSGTTYSKAEFQALAEVLRAAPHVLVMSDEIYDRISLNSKIPFCSFLEADPTLRERTITVNSLSKSAAMTGWRVGWSVTPAWLTPGLITLQGQSTSNISSLSQWAAIAALTCPESLFIPQVESFRRRRDLTLEILKKAGKLKVLAPEGAFYVFVGVGEYLKPGEDSFGFCERLLEQVKVAAVPGTPFGEPSFVRLSFATDDRTLTEGCERFVQFLAQ
jgi:aspartate aminotransferase